MTDAPRPLDTPRDNVASVGISQARLNGQVYTPIDLARRIIATLRWPHGAGTRCVDPSCGDGVFLQAAVERLAAEGMSDSVADVVGFDVDPDAVAAARTRLERVCADLAIDGRPRIEHRDALDAHFEADAVVGNPPYLEAKRMPDPVKRRVRDRCPNAATGAFDLYGAFVELGAESLRPGGELAFIVPNRVLVTRATSQLRTWLGARGRVGVVDLSDARVFGTVGVYPVVLKLDAAAEPGWQLEALDGAPLFALDIDQLDQVGGRMPVPAPAMRPVVHRLLAQPERFGPLSRAVEVRWAVSFHRRGLRDEFVFTSRPATPNARPFVGGVRFAGNRELAPYAIEWAGTWIDYDTERARAAHNPLPPLGLFERPHVVIPQNARRPRAAINHHGYVLKDTFLAATLREGSRRDWLAWLTLVLNSGFGHHLYEALFGGTRKGGGYLQLLGSYLHHLPIPDPPDGCKTLHERLTHDPNDADARRGAEAMVRHAFEVTDDEARAVDAMPLPTH